MTEPIAAATPAAAPPTSPPQPAVQPTATRSRPKRTPAGRASKLALAGGVVGISFGLVGAMAAASQDAIGSTAPVVQRVVVPASAAPAPTQIIVMLPQNMDTPITTIEVPTTAAKPALTIPAEPAAPAPAITVAAPVTESSGS